MPEEVHVLEGIIYKGTTLPHIFVRRKCVLTSEGFTTFQSDKHVSTGKLWQLHRRTALEPHSSSQIRLHERHLRKAGPLRALSAYARDKNVLKLYCFRVEWPDKYAPNHGSSVELGFETLEQARAWHQQISAFVTALGGSGAGSLQTQYSLAGHSNSSLNGGVYGGTGYASAEPSPFTSPVSSFPSTPALLSKQPSMATDACLSPTPASGLLDSSNSNVLSAVHRNSSSQDLSAAGGSALNLKALAPTGQPPANSAGGGAGSTTSSSSSSNALQSQQSGSAAAMAAAMRAHAQSFGGRNGHHQQSSNTGVVVDECMVRWVPYKHANGMAIYYRQTPQEEGKGMPQASGEYMLSTSVQASPECCVSNLMLKADKNGSVLSTAAFMEVLEDNGDMQVWHMVFHPAGSAGVATVLAAPRYTFMHQVLTSYEEGVYAVLFSSVPDEDVKPEWIERANARTQRAHRAVLRSDPGSGSRKPLWRTPVRCRITGAITLSALEGRTGRDSPQTLVTCIVRADFGGWLGSKSMFYGMGQALGLQEALMDRVLMRVMILKEDVEYSRFKTKPFQLLMVQPEDYEGSNKQESSSSGGSQQQQQQQQQQLAALRMASAAGQGVLSQQQQPQQQQQQQHADSLLPVVSLQLPPSRRTTSANSAGLGSAVASGAPGTPTADLMQRTSSAAGAVAVAAAARVSAAASALAAHMTNPQQLWHEKRGSQSGFSASNTPPHSPTKQSLAGGPPVSGLFSKHTSSAAAEVIAAAAPAGAMLGKAQAAAAGQHQQQRIEVSAAESSDLAAGPPAAAERFYSLTGSSAGGAPAAVAEAEEIPSAVGTAERIQEEEGEDEAFEEADDASESRDAGAAATADSASSSTGQVMPYSEAQLEGMIGGTLNRQYWEPIHDGVGSIRDVYSIRGPNYLKDRKKVPAGKGRYKLMAADLVATEHMMDHIGRYLPSVRCNGAAFSFVVDLIINYGSPVLHLVMVFSTDRHPNSLGPCPDDPLDAGEEWTPFDFTMSRFLHGTDDERNGMFKLIPHCAKGSWVVSQSVGTTPVILGRKLATTYHTCDRYIEVDVDVASTQAVAYIVKMVQGATRSMLIDHAYLLESQFAHELPEQLIGAIRYKHLDMTDYSFVNIDHELPFSPVVPGIVGQ